MILNATERKIALCLGKLREEHATWMPLGRLQTMADIPSKEVFDKALSVLYDKGLLQLDFGVRDFCPLPVSLDVAREIKAQEQEAAKPQDRTMHLMARARSHPVMALFVFAGELFSPLVGLIGGIIGIIGGILGIVAFMRGC